MKKTKNKNCSFCHKDFIDYLGRKDIAKFCSHACRARYYIGGLLSKMERGTDANYIGRRDFRKIRKKIIERDKIDFITGIKDDLVVHHIDYDKNNNSEWNLVTLDRQMHSRTNFNRERWKSFFQCQMPSIIHFKGHIKL